MSDGPHRSLPMRKWWRLLAERADNCAYSVDEVAEALVPALEAECRQELSSKFLGLLRGAAAQPVLLSPREFAHSIGANGMSAIGFENRVRDHITILPLAEAASSDYIQIALESAIRGEAKRYLRQIEEHYLRKASTGRARHERDRLYRALDRTNVSVIAEGLLKPSSPASKARLPLKIGLDAGVKLR